MIRIRYLRKFLKSAKKLSRNNQKQLFEKIKIFQDNPEGISLKTHKLSGRLNDKYAFSVNYSIRVVFQYEDRDEVTLLDVGTHEVYK